MEAIRHEGRIIPPMLCQPSFILRIPEISALSLIFLFFLCSLRHSLSSPGGKAEKMGTASALSEKLTTGLVAVMTTVPPKLGTELKSKRFFKL
jgi:hypothetical protein